jgi:hypothetical protein
MSQGIGEVYDDMGFPYPALSTRERHHLDLRTEQAFLISLLLAASGVNNRCQTT